MRSQMKLGWIPDIPDIRDRPYMLMGAAPVELPRAVDLRAGCSPVEHQGGTSSCTANATVGAMEYLEGLQRDAYTDLYRLQLYYDGRTDMGAGQESVDAGCYIRLIIKSAARRGVAPEKLWPFLEAQVNARPPPEVYDMALDRQILEYRRLEGLYELRKCLAEGFPVIFGFSVYENLMADAVRGSGIIPLPDGKLLGGHAVLAVGYDDDARTVLIRNSWGTDWGVQGYGMLPYAYIETGSLSDDYWTIRTQEGGRG